MAVWNFMVIGLCLLLLVFLLWKEIIRLNKKQLFGRIIASILVVVSLACLAFTFNIKNKINKSRSAILLTEGFNKDSIDIYDKNNTPVYYFTDFPTNQSFDSLQIFGYGLTEGQLNEIKATILIFHPTIHINGINSADWPRIINAHELFYVQGNYNNNSANAIKLVLKAYNNPIDSIIIKPNTQQAFSLKMMPQHVGKAIFNLLAIANKDTIEQEPIPMQVLPTNKLNVLVLASSPDFENKFLSNWLAENGFAVALRTTISKNKFKQSFLDTSKFSLNRISPEILNKFDVLVCDATELATISLQELNTIKNQISTNGMGLIIRADTNITTSFYHGIFPIKASTETKQTLHVNIQDSSYNLYAENPAFIQQQIGTQPLIIDNQNRILANSSLFGSGKIILATPDNTYSWLLANNLTAYQNYWTLLLQQAAHKSVRSVDFFIGSSFPFINQPVNLFIASQHAINKINVNESFIAPQQNALFPFLSSGTFWPTFSGWQATILTDGSTNWWYVNDSTDWKSIFNQQKLKATYAYINHQKYNSKTINKLDEFENKPFPKIYFFIVFFICCIYLWVEKKLM